MKFVSQRLFHTKNNPLGDFSCSFLTNNEGYRACVVEDAPQAVKVMGKTRIPAGTYELKLREVNSPLTIKHRNSYQTRWFKANPNWYHIELTGIKDFNYVYVHAGNDDSHTDGCQLLNYVFDFAAMNNPGAVSTQAVDDFYSIVYPLLKQGRRVFYEVRDEQN